MLRIVPTAQLAAGVHLDPSQIALVVVDLLGRPIAHRSLPAPTDSPAEDIARIAGALREMQETLEAEGWRTPAGRAGSVAGRVSCPRRQWMPSRPRWRQGCRWPRWPHCKG